MNSYLILPSPLGDLSLLASATGLRGIFFEQHRHFKGVQQAQFSSEHPILNLAAQQLRDYFAGTRQQFELPLDWQQGTAFQQKVWRALLRIPYASTCSYAELARQIGQASAVRAVGAANGRNPFSIIVPCHRVIASSGKLTGYAGGLSRKQSLLQFEQCLSFTPS